MIEAAIAKGMIVFSLTEHMPRDCVEDLYPEEVGSLFLFQFTVLYFFRHMEKKESQKESQEFLYFASNNSFSSVPPPLPLFLSRERRMHLSPNKR